MRSSTIGAAVNSVPGAAMSYEPSTASRAYAKLLRGVRVEGQQGLALGHRVARLGVQSPRPRPPAPGPPCGRGPRRGARRRRRCRRRRGGSGRPRRGPSRRAVRARRRQGGVRVAALGRDHAAPDVHRRAVGQGLRRVRVLHARPRRASRGPARGSARRRRAGPPPARTSTDSRTSRALPAVQAERGRHVGEQGDRPHAVVRAQADHGGGQFAGVVERLHEGAACRPSRPGPASPCPRRSSST